MEVHHTKRHYKRSLSATEREKVKKKIRENDDKQTNTWQHPAHHCSSTATDDRPKQTTAQSTNHQQLTKLTTH